MPIKKTFDVLSVENRHPRDVRIVFEEEGHKYIIDGDSSGWISATSLLSKFHEPFDSNKAAESFMKGSKYKSGEHPLSGKGKEEIKNHWKLENYRGTALHARMEYLMNRPDGLKAVSEGEGLVAADGMFADGSHKILRCSSSNRVYEIQADSDSPGDFLGYLWEDGTIRRNSSDESELEANEPVLEYEEALVESRQVKHFWNNNPHLEPYRSEWMIWDRDYKIAGTMDAVFHDKRDDTYWIYDWKRVQSGLEADLEATRYGYVMDDSEWLQPVNWYTKKMNGAASELYDTKYWHYCLQLNLYRYILEKDYGLKIKGMILVQFHPLIGDVPKYHRVVFLESPIIKVLKDREEDLTRLMLKNKKESETRSVSPPIPSPSPVKSEETKEVELEYSDTTVNRVLKKGQITPSSTIKRTMVTRSMAKDSGVQTTLQFHKIL